MHQCNYCNQKCSRKYNLKVHIERMHSEDNINNRNNLTLPPLAQPLLPAPPPPPTQEDYTYKMEVLNRRFVKTTCSILWFP